MKEAYTPQVWCFVVLFLNHFSPICLLLNLCYCIDFVFKQTEKASIMSM